MAVFFGVFVNWKDKLKFSRVEGKSHLLFSNRWFGSFTARALHHVMEWRNHKVTWPRITVPITELVNVIIKRINEASVSLK